MVSGIYVKTTTSTTGLTKLIDNATSEYFDKGQLICHLHRTVHRYEASDHRGPGSATSARRSTRAPRASSRRPSG
eukprot:7212997-Heterocapsa_arctica.AAC.1